MATYVWTGKVNNLFNNPKNWSLGGQEAQSVPSAGDAIQIPGGLADEESSNSVASAEVDAGTWYIGGSATVAGTVVTNGSAGAFGVVTDAGFLSLNSGASDFGQIFIQGGTANVTGNVDVEGIGSNLSTGVFCVAGGTLNMQGQLTVATTSGKDGLFLVDGGGQATIQGGDASTAAVVVSVANTAGEIQVSTDGKLTVIGGLYLGPSDTQSDISYLYIVQGGSVDVSRPAAPDKDIVAGVNTGTQATIQVSGAHSTLTSEQAAILGDAGNAQLTIDTGGAVQAKGNLTAGHQSSGSAAISVSGSGSILVASGGFVLGDAGAAQLTVNSGGKVQADNDLTAGNQAHASGGIILTGSGSSLNVNGDLVLGKDGEGDLTMSDNANLTVSGTWRGGVDAKSTSMARVGGSGTVTIDGDMLIGVSGTQTVNVTTGAHITVSGNANIGQQPTSGSTSGSTGSGALSVDGTGSLFEAGYMTIAGVTVPANNKNGEPNGTSGRWDYSSGGSGSLTVSSGGHVAVDHTLTLNDDPNSTSAAPSITVNSGGLIEVGGNGASPASNLFMQIDNGGLVVGHGAIVAITPASGTTPAMLGDIINNATGSGGFEAKEGTLVIDGNVTGGGNIHIDQSSTVELGGSFGTADHPGGTVVLENTDAHTLILDDPANFHGTITGLDIGDRIILRNTNLANGNAVVDATIGDLNGVQTLGIQEGTDSNHTITFPDGTTSLRFTIQGVGGNPIPVATNPGTGTTAEFFNVTQSADGQDTILTLQEGNPVDLAVNAPAPRQTYGVTGAGITVGVISDSFDALGGEGNDLAMGALPANVNAVDLIGGTDEGRAMAQIVHDIAPGAAIDFYGVGGLPNMATMVTAIQQLQAAGCQIIVDDMGVTDEPLSGEAR